MKAFWQLLAICILVVSTAQQSRAQLLFDTVEPLTQTVPSADGFGTPFSTSISPGNWLPGRLWMEVNLAQQGLGYYGSFATVGGKTRLFQDALDGRWLGEANFNVGLESGGFFYNVGIERSFSVNAANSDFYIGAWFDSDSDDQAGDFIHTFHQVGVSGGVRTPFFDLTGNGYFPVGSTDYSLGDPTGENCFLNHNIVLQPGIDTALQGFDATLSIRPGMFATYDGSFQLGGYQYTSPLIDTFTGIRAGTSFRAFNTLIIGGEYTYDDRFDSAGFVRLGWDFGGPGGDQAYGITGRDLEKTRRQSHVSRYNQDLILAINPTTGLPYNVLHVDNLAAPGGPGTFEARFDELADAEAASSPDDIIFVHRGDGTTRNQDTGIILKDRQQLLGAGVEHIIDTQFGGFVLCNDIDGRRARITNDGGPAVTLANGNTVRGLILDGTGVNMTHGILGLGGPGGLNGGRIENNIIRFASLNGVTLDVISGDWSFQDNVVNRSGQDGINISRAIDPTSEFLFARNNLSNNIRDGLNMSMYDGDRFFFVDNVTNVNGRHGMNLEDYTGTGSNWVFLRPTSGGNGSAGLRISEAAGIFDFLDVFIQNNTGSGIQLLDVRNVRPVDRVFIGTLDAAANSIAGNGTGAGAGIESVINSGTQRLVVRNSLINNNGVGILARANNALTVMDTAIIENDAISNNSDDGIRIVSSLGATHNVVITENVGLLNMNNNGTLGGHGISLLAENGGATTSTINADISNVIFTTSGAAPTDSAIFGLVDRNALMNVNITDVTVQDDTVNGIPGTTGDGFFFDLGSNNLAISNINITRANINGVADDGIDFDLSRTQHADIRIAQTVIDNSGGDGLEYTAAGDTRSVLTSLASTYSNSGEDGMEIDTFGTAEMLLMLTSNTATGNATSGLNVNAGGVGSHISSRMQNNNFTTNGTFGAFMRTSNSGVVDGGNLDVLMISNAISNNDTTATVNRDMNVLNSSLGSVCLAMSNNFFVLPVRLENLGAGVDFVLELDGSTNGIGVPGIQVGAFDLRAFGSTCEPAIAAQEAVFAGLGF